MTSQAEKIRDIVDPSFLDVQHRSVVVNSQVARDLAGILLFLNTDLLERDTI